MTTITDEPFRADVDEVLARYGLDDPGHAVLASDLSDAFDEAIRDSAAEVERLRAAAGERDALQEAVRKYGDHLTGCPQSQHPHSLGTATTMPCTCGFDAALAAVPEPQPQAGDRLAVAERAARVMKMEAALAIMDHCGHNLDSDMAVAAVKGINPADVARRAVDTEGGG